MIAAVSLPSVPNLTAVSDLASERTVEDDRARERAWVEAAQAGDRDAMRALYDLHAPRIFRAVLLPLVRDRHLAEDLLADTFVKAIEKLDAFRWQGRGMGPWLMRIAKNLALDHLRRSGRFTRWPEGFEGSIPAPENDGADVHLGRAEVSEVLAERIEMTLESVNPRYRRVLELRVFEKRAREESAAELEISVGTLDVLLHRACRAFRKEYMARWGAESPEEIFAP